MASRRRTRNAGRMKRLPAAAPLAFLAACAALSGPAFANNLKVPEDAPPIAHLGATALLVAHIGGGAIGIVTGLAILFTRKGSRLHRGIGLVFLVAMGITYLIGAGVAPFLDEGQRPNFTAGVLALYLLLSGWRAARGGDKPAGLPEALGLVAALGIAGMGVLFMQMAKANGTGSVDGSPPQSIILFISAGSLAAAGEANVLLRRRIAGVSRRVRHLWRMCFSWFLASGSFFFGQQAFQPVWFRDSILPLVFGFAPIGALVVWAGLSWAQSLRRRPATA